MVIPSSQNSEYTVEGRPARRCFEHKVVKAEAKGSMGIEGHGVAGAQEMMLWVSLS